MTTNDHDLAARLAALADESAPPPRFTTATSITEGTTRLRRRKRATVGAIAAVTVAVVATTALLAPGGTSATPAPPAAPTATTSPSPSATPTPTRAGIDPLTTEVHFGWLPDWAGGEKGVGYIESYHGHEAQARAVGRDNPSRIIVRQYPAGSEPPMTTTANGKLVKVDADPIDGRTAYWVVPDGSWHSQPTLRWQTASGRWAEITGYGSDPEDVTQEVLHKAAADVHFGQWNVPLPVQITGLPEAFKVTDAEFTRPDTNGSNGWSLWLMLRDGDKTVSVGVQFDGSLPTPTYTDTAGSPYIDPHPPLTTVQNGLNISVGAGSGVPASLEQLGGLPWLLSHIKSLGPDDANWTTNVVVP
ncbi:hypothetical protein F7Q99_09395 [Streptomyces kaniharaensis]|uniref:Uncharacterized protein n=1 Tax=Streptomyces kaniharaensis TaxID=212423 RepID=A0A6N7KLT6_9ACTN|nr:hypothetical protein [Streptomyces kaniharaensis]MQS12492.1 hypothetical protein [Streptomyces kaniharaensis]